METSGHIIVTEEVGTCVIKLPVELRPGRQYFGPDNNHTGGLQIKTQGKILYLPLDVEEIKMLEEGLHKIKQMPIQEPKLVIAATDMPTSAEPLNN